MLSTERAAVLTAESGGASPPFSPVLAADATPGQCGFLPAPSLAAALGVATPDAARRGSGPTLHVGDDDVATPAAARIWLPHERPLGQSPPLPCADTAPAQPAAAAAAALGDARPHWTLAAAVQPTAAAPPAAARPLPAGFSPVQAAAVTPQPRFAAAPSLADTVAGIASMDPLPDGHVDAAQSLQKRLAVQGDSVRAAASPSVAAAAGSACSEAALSVKDALPHVNETVHPAEGHRVATFSPVEAASMSPEPRFVAAPSLAAMAGLSTPDPWRSRRRDDAFGGEMHAASQARSALAETERGVRARVQVRAALGTVHL